MSRTKDMLCEMEDEIRKKERALLDVPAIMALHRRMLESVEDRLLRTESQIEQLAEAHQHPQNWKFRFREYVLAGIVGAIISMSLTILIM